MIHSRLKAGAMWDEVFLVPFEVQPKPPNLNQIRFGRRLRFPEAASRELAARKWGWSFDLKRTLCSCYKKPDTWKIKPAENLAQISIIRAQENQLEFIWWLICFWTSLFDFFWCWNEVSAILIGVVNENLTKNSRSEPWYVHESSLRDHWCPSRLIECLLLGLLSHLQPSNGQTSLLLVLNFMQLLSDATALCQNSGIDIGFGVRNLTIDYSARWLLYKIEVSHSPLEPQLPAFTELIICSFLERFQMIHSSRLHQMAHAWLLLSTNVPDKSLRDEAIQHLIKKSHHQTTVPELRSNETLISGKSHVFLSDAKPLTWCDALHGIQSGQIPRISALS